MGVRVGRGRVGLLLASSSVAALLIGGGVPPAFAICPTSFTNTTAPGCTNAGNITGIAINNATITTSIVNSGTISLNGITLTNGSTITGAITDPGTINGGISVDRTSVITTTSTTSTAHAIDVTGLRFTGGITNAGAITGANGGAIRVSGTVTQFGSGVLISFAGGITNSGTLTGNRGIEAELASTFSQGITNTGTIDATQLKHVSNEPGVGILVAEDNVFSGPVSNGGTITSGEDGILVNTVSTFIGAVTNSGHITVTGFGINVFGVSTFSGNIANSGVISGPNGIAIAATTLVGSIVAGGAILATTEGIQIDFQSKIASTTAAIMINGSTFTGGVSNGGTITVSGNPVAPGIIALGVASFAGGFTNGGRISAPGVGMLASNVSLFSGGILNGGTLTAQTGIAINNTSTFSGNVSNSGGITATLRGFAILGTPSFNGNVSNSGRITAATGILIVGSTINGAIVDSGTIAGSTHGIAIDATSKISPAVTGIVVSGTTFSGGISNGGTITGRTGMLIGNAVHPVNFSGGITNSGTITAGQAGIQVGFVTSFVGAISNAGTISAGTVGITIGGGVTFAAGSGIVNSGTVSGTTAAIDVTGATSPVTITQAGGLVSGAIKLSTNADVLTVTGGTIAGNIVGAGSSDTVNFAPGSGNTFTYGASFGFSGVNQVNIASGTVVLNGTNSATNVDVTGGMLAGTGTLDPNTVTIHSGGTFAPGNGTPGSSMTIAGNLAFQPGATYQVQLNPTTASFATVGGTVTLAGTVIAVFAPGSYVTKQYTILQSGGLSGSFAGVNEVNPPTGFTASLSQTSDDVFLNLDLALAASGNNFNINQANVANAIGGFFNGGGGLPPSFVGIVGLTGPNLANALTKLDGEAATDAQKGAFDLMTGFLDLMLDPFVDGRGGTAGSANGFAAGDQASLPPDVALAYASVLKAPPKPATFDQRWSVWGSAFGGYNTTRGDPVVGSSDVTASDFGFAAGADYRVSPDTILGFALAGGGTNWGLAQNLGGGRSDAFQAGVYGTTHRGPAYLAGALAFANHWMTTDRFAPVDHLQATFDAQSYGARLEGGYRFALPASNLGITPYAAAQTQRFHTPAFSETDLTGAGFGLSYAAMDATDTRSELGARFDTLQALDHMPLLLRARVAWAHDWVSNPALDAVFQALPGASFIVNGAAAPKDSALTSASAELEITPAWSLAAKFDGEFAAGAQTYAGTGTLRYAW